MTDKTVDLDIEGMTCSSCAARIERKLTKVPGVEASVNFATERARVTAPVDVPVSRLLDTVAAAGYRAQVHESPMSGPDRSAPAVPGHGGGDMADMDMPVPAMPGHDMSSMGRLDMVGMGDMHKTMAMGTADQFRQRFLISAVLTLPVVVLSMIPTLQFPNWQWLCFALASPVAVWGAWPFHRVTVINARHGSVSMDTLVSLGVAAAYLWSVWALFFGGAGQPDMRMSMSLFAGSTAHHDIYLEVASAVTCFLLLGRWIEARAKRESQSALRALLEMGAKDAVVMRDGAETRVPIGDVRVGDVFVVRPGEKVATDGIVVEGASAIDESMLTGESMPVEVTPGHAVTGATVNSSGRLLVRASRVGSDTELARIGRMVEDAQMGKTKVQRLADRISMVFVPVVIGLAVVAFAIWALSGAGIEAAFTAAVATLIVACPCALGLATPTALLVGTGRGSQLGIVIRGAEVLERTRAVDTVVLDKTGTVTSGEMSVAAVRALSGVDRGRVLSRAAAVERGSEHPLGRAIVAAASGSLSEVADFASVPGGGVSGVVDDAAVVAGKPDWVASTLGHELPSQVSSMVDDASRVGRTAIVVAWDGQPQGVVEVSDTVKPSSPRAVALLRDLGLNPVLLTGDAEGPARAVASAVGIDDVLSGVSPQGKLDEIRRLLAEGHSVAMVGDGVNDAAALAAADLGIAMGAGTDAAIAAADIVVTSGDLVGVADAVRLSRRTLGTIKGNLFWAFAYNVVAIPLAMAGLLNPLISGAAMAFSSVFVVTNSLRLRGFQPTPR